MALDQAENFVRGTVDASISQGDTTISVTDASAFPDPSNGNYNLVLWDSASHNIPDNDPNVEIVRVTARDTGANDLTVTRGQENTSDAAHPDTSVLQMAWTAKMRDDTQTEIDAVYGSAAIDDTDSPYTTQGEEVITADTSSGAVTVTLATADASKDKPVTVVNISGSNSVTVNTEGGETIDPDGDSSKSWSTEGWAVTFTPDGSNWDSSLDAEYESVTTDAATIGSQTEVSNLNYSMVNATAVSGASFGSLITFGSGVAIVGGVAYGESPTAVRYTFDDGSSSTQTIGATDGSNATGRDANGDLFGVFPLPRTSNVIEIEIFNSVGASSDYGAQVIHT